MNLSKKRRRLWLTLKFTGLFALSLGGLLVIAQLALTYYGDASNVQQAFYRTRYGWLLWRTVLYCAIGFGLWTLYHQPKISDTARCSLRRSALAAAAFATVSELSVWFGGTGL
ncbi:hypothetical protein AB7W12_09285 [Providencia rettgeri]|uniref:hypothetical protein n=1 Tax=Providencia rettgeri TaxID=587 RepID=UPI002053BC07|nr:hypothetical protein LV777_04115 [Providencia rettgeri]